MGQWDNGTMGQWDNRLAAPRSALQVVRCMLRVVSSQRCLLETRKLQLTSNTVHDSILRVTNGITPTRTEVSALRLRLYSLLLEVIPKGPDFSRDRPESRRVGMARPSDPCSYCRVVNKNRPPMRAPSGGWGSTKLPTTGYSNPAIGSELLVTAAG